MQRSLAQRRGLSAEMIMSNTELALKIFIIWFIDAFLFGIAINLTTKKEYRKTLKELAVEHIRMTTVFGGVGAVICALVLILFEVF